MHAGSLVGILDRIATRRKENMFTRQLADVEKSDFFVNWGNGTSHRLLTQQDGMGLDRKSTRLNSSH